MPALGNLRQETLSPKTKEQKAPSLNCILNMGEFKGGVNYTSINYPKIPSPHSSSSSTHLCVSFPTCKTGVTIPALLTSQGWGRGLHSRQHVSVRVHSPCPGLMRCALQRWPRWHLQPWVLFGFAHPTCRRRPRSHARRMHRMHRA
jgi:hypothetical protein